MDALSSFSFIKNLGLNWVDFLILLVILFYAIEGYAVGFLEAVSDLASFVLAFLASLAFYNYFGKLFVLVFAIPPGFANAIGFFVVGFLVEILASLVLKKIIIANLSRHMDFSDKFVKKINLFLGIIPSILSGILLISFILILIITLPFSVVLKKSISTSKVGNKLVVATSGIAKDVNNIFKGAINESLAFLTVEPKGDEIVDLNFKLKNYAIDKQAEQKMFDMVNEERKKVELNLLEKSPQLTEVGRKHCMDMFERGYFSHYTPQGISPFDRMKSLDISYIYAGENLAFAPNTELAMDGLMKSTGHRENILSSDFGKLGVGVIDGGTYGKMFCQEFTD
ncbi:MAG TPA: CvpA family protein [Patescibacteria group bacterium]|nr:CvpA family protein [Patescibacteria group bacterium]